jgi:hypothetical protein
MRGQDGVILRFHPYAVLSSEHLTRGSNDNYEMNNILDAMISSTIYTHSHELDSTA